MKKTLLFYFLKFYFWHEIYTTPKKLTMKKTLLIIALSVFSFAAFSQKYKSLADTIKLNKEYLDVTNDIVKLKAKLEIAQNELPVLKAKAVSAHADAKTAAGESSKQAAKAANADLGELKEADKKASKALKAGYAAKSADEDVADMEAKIVSLNGKISDKQKRLQELDNMRTAIYSVIHAVADTIKTGQ